MSKRITVVRDDLRVVHPFNGRHYCALKGIATLLAGLTKHLFAPSASFGTPRRTLGLVWTYANMHW